MFAQLVCCRNWSAFHRIQQDSSECVQLIHSKGTSVGSLVQFGGTPFTNNHALPSNTTLWRRMVDKILKTFNNFKNPKKIPKNKIILIENVTESCPYLLRHEEIK